MNIYLAYDTSCYTTSIACVNENGQVLASCRKMLPVERGGRGLRQSEAVFKHIQQINEVNQELREKLRGLDCTVLAVGASVKPREAVDSYMPVFKVGEAFAEHLAQNYGVPFVASNHQQGHIYAAKHQSGLQAEKFLGFHLSGGTTELLYCAEKIHILSRTQDISAGQLIDRIGVALGLDFPSGVYLEKLAEECLHFELKIPASVNLETGDCHYSGAETMALNMIKKYSPNEVAFAVFHVVCSTVCKMIMISCKKEQIQDVLLFGGVASSNLLRSMLIQRMHKLNPNIRLYFGKNEYSGDNAVGIALYTRKVCKDAAG